MGSMRLAGLVAVLVIGGVLWAYGQGRGGGSSGGTPAYCADVDRLTGVLTDLKQGGDPTSRSATLGAIQTSLTTDAASADPVAAAALTRVAADVGDWRTAIGANDAVDQTIALDRILSDVGSVPGC